MAGIRKFDLISPFETFFEFENGVEKEDKECVFAGNLPRNGNGTILLFVFLSFCGW